MKKGLLSWLMVWVCLLMVGCQDEAVVTIPQVEKGYESFTATIADIGMSEAKLEGFGYADTRSHLEEGHRVVWDEGDSIGIYSDKQGVGKFIYHDGAFYGDRIEGNEFHAFYPYKADAIDAENPNLIHTRLHYKTFHKEGRR